MVTRAIFRGFPSFRRLVATRSGVGVSASVLAEGRRWTTVNRAFVWRQTAAMGTEWIIAGEKPRPVSEAGLSRSRPVSLRRCWRFLRCDDPSEGFRPFRCRSRRGSGETGRSRFETPGPGGHTPPGSQSELDITGFLARRGPPKKGLRQKDFRTRKASLPGCSLCRGHCGERRYAE